MATWPLDLPSQNYSIIFGASASEVVFDSERVRQVSTLSDGLLLVNVNFIFTLSEYETFKTFVDGTLNQGTDWFDIDLLTSDTVKTHEARFVNGQYKSQYIADNAFSVSAQLECFEPDFYEDANETMYYWYDLGALSLSINASLFKYANESYYYYVIYDLAASSIAINESILNFAES